MNDIDRRRMPRRDIAAALALATAATLSACADDSPECGPVRRPGDADFAAVVGHDKAAFLDRALSVIEQEVVPKTRKGVRGGSKLFGAAVLRKSDLSTVIATTNAESDNPLLHGEIQTLNEFYGLPREERPPVGESIFVSTHEPCPLCLSGITWAGFDNFFYLFTYEDSRDAFAIPHDLEILEEVFRCPDGSYSEKNSYWSSWNLKDLIASLDADTRPAFEKRVAALRETYDELSAIYQESKEAGADIPLK